ncbi:ABC transporter permease [Acuticoccus kandeliae]|uniref:ABC transporter permease n=1 Tax=Acuticoccus kandeliae TaxID=2073160 RepID=UPI000D3E0879|nr:ABC transporter permease [Acuticoccus kandeliae]
MSVVSSAAPAPRPRRRLRLSPASVAIGAFAWAGLIFMALPLVVIISASFTETEYLAFPPHGFTWRWYGAFLGDPSYIHSIVLSASLAVGATIGATLLGVPAALILARVPFTGSKAIAALFLSPLILPVIVIGVAILQYASALGFARTFTALLVGHIVIVMPYIVRTTLAALAGFQISMEEAAQDLGASATETFFLVTLPQIKPGLIAGCIFAFIISWINVELSVFNTTANLLPIPVKLFNYIQYNVDPMIAAVSAGTIYVSIVIVVIVDWTIGIDKVTGTR